MCYWDGTGDEPARRTNAKQFLWDCVQEQSQDTRNRYDPRLKDTFPFMGIHNRRDRRELFRNPRRETITDIDDEAWGPGHDIEDVLLLRLEEHKLGDYLGPD